MYQLYLDENFADQDKYDWHLAQKKLLNQLRQDKQLIAPKESSPQNAGLNSEGERLLNPNIGQEYTKELKKEVDDALKEGERGLEKAIAISNFIKIELDKQISQLDAVYEQNKDFETRMKRAKEGLIVILRQAMTNKITRFFAVLLVLAIIGVLVVTILRSQGIVG
jgi:hypothetical protein